MADSLMADKAVFERRLLTGVTAMTLLGFLLQIIAVSTDSWLIFDLRGGGLFQNDTNNFLMRVYNGLWRICKVERTDKDVESTEDERCEYHNFFPTTKEIIYDESIDRQILDYMRTGCAFSIITIILIFLTHLFAVYTIKRPRYTIKRLTALLHIMTAVCNVVMNEIFIRTTQYANDHVPERFPSSAEYEYGYSFILSWIVFAIYLVAGLTFLFVSHKRKTDMADIEDRLAEEDEPMQLGR